MYLPRNSKNKKSGISGGCRSSSPLALLIAILLVGALIASALLLCFDFLPFLFPFLSHAPISALPLLLIGFSYLALQVPLHLKLLELLKRVMLASAFILWGIDQLLPSGQLATTIGDIVIVLYIFDLALLIKDVLRGSIKG